MCTHNTDIQCSLHLSLCACVFLCAVRSTCELTFTQASARSFYVAALKIRSVLSSSGGQLHIKGFMFWLIHAMSTSQRTSTPASARVVQVLLHVEKGEGLDIIVLCVYISNAPLLNNSIFLSDQSVRDKYTSFICESCIFTGVYLLVCRIFCSCD